jgi:hypothetical protein
VHVYRDVEVLDPVPGDLVPLSDLGVTLPPTSTDLAAARTGDLVSLAVVPSAGGSVRLASTGSTTDPTWSPTVRDFPVDGVRQGVGSITVAHVGFPDGPSAASARLFVVERVRSSDGLSELAYFTDLDPTVRVVPGSDGESSPALSRDASGLLELWSEARGNLRHRRGDVLPVLDVAWSLLEDVPVPRPWLPLPSGRAGGLFPGSGLALGPHLDRMQIYLRRLTESIVHHARGAQIGGFVEIDGGWRRRPAVLAGTAPDGRPAQVLLSVGNLAAGRPDELVLRYHESD